MEEYLFKGVQPGGIRWIQEHLGFIPLPPVIRDNGFAVFNGKNYTTERE